MHTHWPLCDRTLQMPPRLSAGWSALLASVCLLGCAGGPRQPAQPGPPLGASAASVAVPATAASVAAPAASLAEPAARSAPAGEQALAQGLKAYQSAQYPQAEAQFKLALKSGLAPADAAQAHKHLAFIYCTSRREALCASAFKAARAADAKFALSKAEAGHPMWSQVYRKALGLK